MGDEATGADVSGSGGIFQSLLDAVVQYKALDVAKERARTDTSGGYARATDGSLVKQSTQQPVVPGGAGVPVPVYVWVLGGVGAILVLLAVLKR